MADGRPGGDRREGAGAGDPGSLPSPWWHCRQKTGRLCGPSFPGQPLLCFPQDGPEFGASMTQSPLSAGGGGDLPPSRVSALPPRLWVWPLSPSATFVRRCWRPALLRGDLGSIAVSGPRAANSPSPQGAKPFAKCLPWWWRGQLEGRLSSLLSLFTCSASPVTVGGRGREPAGNRVAARALGGSARGCGDGHT